jgi:hypothetical protein
MAGWQFPLTPMLSHPITPAVTCITCKRHAPSASLHSLMLQDAALPAGMRKLVQTLLDSLPLLVDVIVLLAWLFCVFGIVALQLFMGRQLPATCILHPSACQCCGASITLEAGILFLFPGRTWGIALAYRGKHRVRKSTAQSICFPVGLAGFMVLQWAAGTI